MLWAILSGIEGNLAAYEAVLADIREQRQPVTALYILGDVVGLKGDNNALVERLRSPRRGEPTPQVCTGWWEEQCFSLHGLRGLPDAPELVKKFGPEAAKALWEGVSRDTLRWLTTLDFGFHELDCLLIHGSTVSYADELTPETSPIQLCDRLIRADANVLFCGRSGLAFDCWVEPQKLQSVVTTLDTTAPPQDYGRSPRRIVGVGNVGRQVGHISYVLYQPGTNQLSYRNLVSRRVSVPQGFGQKPSSK